jgi:hypothetical protein
MNNTICLYCGEFNDVESKECKSCKDDMVLEGEALLSLSQDMIETETLRKLSFVISRIAKIETSKVRRVQLFVRYLKICMPNLPFPVIDDQNRVGLDETLAVIGLEYTPWVPGYKNGNPSQTRFWINLGVILTLLGMLTVAILKFALRHM